MSRRVSTALAATVCLMGTMAGCASQIAIHPPDDGDDGPIPAARLVPADLVYEGAFHLPDDAGASTWEWAGELTLFSIPASSFSGM